MTGKTARDYRLRAVARKFFPRLLSAALALAFLLPAIATAQDEKPSAALAPVTAIGKISEGEKWIVFNSLQSHLSRAYQLIPQSLYQQAEEEAFASLSVEQCTADNCIRKIQEILQVERLIVLQIIREQEFTQLSLTMARGELRIAEADNCINCSIVQLEAKVAGLVSAIKVADLGGAPVPPVAPVTPAPPAPAASVAPVTPAPPAPAAPVEPVAPAAPPPAVARGEQEKKPTAGKPVWSLWSGILAITVAGAQYASATSLNAEALEFADLGWYFQAEAKRAEADTANTAAWVLGAAGAGLFYYYFVVVEETPIEQTSTVTGPRVRVPPALLVSAGPGRVRAHLTLRW